MRKLTLKQIGEYELINILKNNFIKDLEIEDATVLEEKNLVIALGSAVEGVHFDMKFFKFYEIGWRAIACCLSDIAAMGAVTPKFCLVSLFLPSKLKLHNIEEIYKGMNDICKLYHTKIIGGDTSKAEKLCLQVTIIGEYSDKKKLKRRKGAKPGDKLGLTGTIGDAACGLYLCKNNIDKFSYLVKRYKLPTPRIKEAWVLSRFVHAMTDISDGLSNDAITLAKTNRLGIRIYKNNLPFSSQFIKFCNIIKNINTTNLALYGGDDFELLFAIQEEMIQKASKMVRFNIIGEFLEKENYELFNGHKNIPLQIKGFQHFL
jgi:thiamine-monophosphate kinase